MKYKLVVILLCMSFTMPAFAGFENPFSYFQVYSADGIGTASQGYGSDFQGTAGAGGDVYLSHFTCNDHLKNDYGLHAGGNATLVGGSYYKNVEVGGNLHIQSLNINGDVYVGGSVNGSSGGTVSGNVNAAGRVNLPRSLTVRGGVRAGQSYSSFVDHASVQNHFDSVSNYYGSKAANASYVNRYGELRVSLGSGMNVLTMTASEFKNAWGLTVSGGGDGALIINLTGEVVELDSTNLAGIDSSKVLLNFVDATTLNLSGGNTLNILAINADTNFAHGHVDGNLIVGNLIGNGQVNAGSFDPGFETVPEPATFALLGLGGLLIRRRRRNA